MIESPLPDKLLEFCSEAGHAFRCTRSAIEAFADLIERTGELNAKQGQDLGRLRGAAVRMTEQIHQYSAGAENMTEPPLPDKVLQLLGEVSHDLKSPLAAIAGFADLIEATGDLNPKQTQYLGRLRGTAVRMTEQIHQLLDVVWIESGMKLTLAETDIVEVLRSAVELMETRATAKQVTVILDVMPHIPVITADATRLSQVAVNLMSNAIKYSKQGGTVTARIWLDGDDVAFSVRDEGVGIASENLPHLFDLFYRVDDKANRQTEGNGLGLYIVRSIVEAHGGHISVQSEPGAGSTFTVRLPGKNKVK